MRAYFLFSELLLQHDPDCQLAGISQQYVRVASKEVLTRFLGPEHGPALYDELHAADDMQGARRWFVVVGIMTLCTDRDSAPKRANTAAYAELLAESGLSLESDLANRTSALRLSKEQLKARYGLNGVVLYYGLRNCGLADGAISPVGL